MKTVLYIHDFAFKFKDSTLYTAVGMPEEYFNRFLESGFSKVNLCSRLHFYDKNNDSGFQYIKNKNISNIFDNKTNYASFINPKNILRIKHALSNADLLVINFPTIISIIILLYRKLFNANLPYVCEVAADTDQFKTKPFGNLITKFFNIVSERIIEKAGGAVYVNKFLYKKFPNKNSIIASNVNIKSTYKRDYSKLHDELKFNINIAFAGGLNERKGMATLLKVAQYLIKVKKFNNVFLDIMGGHPDQDWKKIAKEYEISDHVRFHGILTSSEMKSIFKRSHFYLQPSLTEGLPRSTIEAMSFGIPIIATNIPAFSDLIEVKYLVPINDHITICHIISDLIINKNQYVDSCIRNENISSEYIYSHLQIKRVDFYNQFSGN